MRVHVWKCMHMVVKEFNFVTGFCSLKVHL